MKVGQLQQRVAVELRRQPGDGDLDILERRDPRRLMHTQRRQQHGRDRGSVAYAVRCGPAPGTKQQRHQPGQVERDLHHRQQQDRAERPVEQRTRARGNSGEKTEPDERRLQRWYCDATSTMTARASFTPSGQGSGHTNRVRT